MKRRKWLLVLSICLNVSLVLFLVAHIFISRGPEYKLIHCLGHLCTVEEISLQLQNHFVRLCRTSELPVELRSACKGGSSVAIFRIADKFWYLFYDENGYVVNVRVVRVSPASLP